VTAYIHGILVAVYIHGILVAVYIHGILVTAFIDGVALAWVVEIPGRLVTLQDLVNTTPG